MTDRGGGDAGVRVGTPEAEVGAVWRDQRNVFLMASARQVHLIATIVGTFTTGLAAVIFIHGGMPGWRIAAQLIAFAGLMAVQRFVLLRTKTPAEFESTFARMVITAQIYVATALTLTGGIGSPLLPILPITTAFPTVFFGPHRLSRRLLCATAALTITVAVLPETIVGPRMDRTHYIAIAVLSLVWSLFAVAILMGRIREAIDRATTAIDDLRAERVADAEAQMRRLQAVSSKVAHELKNPLAAVKGLAQLLARSTSEDKSRERLAVVESEVARMEGILHEYLSFSRPLEDLEPVPLDLAAVIEEALSVLAGRLEQARIALRLRTRPTAMIGDPRRLRDAALNLLSNAIDATPAGGAIDVAVRSDGDCAVLEVRDTGRGIATADLAKLGTSFFTTRTEGTGLGVVLAIGVVSQHGGNLHYASEVGRGTQVTVSVPRAPGAPRDGHILTTSSNLPARAAEAA